MVGVVERVGLVYLGGFVGLCMLYGHTEKPHNTLTTYKHAQITCVLTTTPTHSHPPTHTCNKLIGFTNHLNIGAFMEKGLSMRAGQTPVQKYMHQLLDMVLEVWCVC